MHKIAFPSPYSSQAIQIQMYHLKQPYNYEPTIFIALFSNEPTDGEQIKIPALWLVHQLRGHYLHCLIGRSPNEHLFKACSHLRSMQLTKELTMNSKTGLLNVASDHKIFTYSRFLERPWALLSLKHNFLLLKKTKWSYLWQGPGWQLYYILQVNYFQF